MNVTVSHDWIASYVLCIVRAFVLVFLRNMHKKKGVNYTTHILKLVFILVLITDTLSSRHSYMQVLNMLLGPLAILTCGILLVISSEKHHVLVLFRPLVDPIICCFLFLSYLLMISIPSMIRTYVRLEILLIYYSSA